MSRRTEYDADTGERLEYEYEERIDADTGEVIKTTSTKRVGYKDAAFFRTNRELIVEVSKILGKNELILLNFFIGKVGVRTNEYRESGSKIATYLGMTRSSFTKAMTNLRVCNLVKSAGHREWMLNPEVGICCEESFRPYLQKKFDEIQQFRLNEVGGDEYVSGQSLRDGRFE